MNNIFESIAAATKPVSVSINEDEKKLAEMNAKLIEVVKSYEFETKEAWAVQEDTLMGIGIMGKTFTLKCKP